MYDIRQFKPALYAVLILGITGFALASESPGMWVMAVGAILLNAWLIRAKLFRPLPRFLANLVTILALVYVIMLVASQSVSTPILVVGQFLVLLQVVKLYEQRANRDYAQLLVLSLLLVVAASISTASLFFGVLLVFYLVLSLYVCLLFHLKVETDYAKQAMGISEERINPLRLQQDQMHLSRSMRRLTAFVAAVAVFMAVFVFLFFPRGSTGSVLGPLQFRPAQTLTGFTDQPLSFQQVARITQNPQIVAYVSVWRNEEPVQGTTQLLLRGKTLQYYSGKDNSAAGRWQWTRSVFAFQPQDIRPGGTASFQRRGGRATLETTLLGVPLSTQRLRPVDDTGTTLLRQRVTLDPTGTPVIFALPGVFQFTPAFDARVIYSPDDHTILAAEPLMQRISYEVVSDDQMFDYGPTPPRPAILDRDTGDDRPSPAVLTQSVIDARIEQLARQPDVSGSDERGLLAERRTPSARVTPVDLDIAANIERYLRSNFLYTLDLTDATRAAGEDPMVAFLLDFKRGHCEYFAGAMTLLCQSLGMQARVVIGFKSDEYNDIGGYYIVRQSHAHAWVEVLGSDGRWHTFDPTSGRSAAATGGWWQQLRHLFNFLEFSWANSIIAYDRESRSSIINQAEQTLVDTASNSTIRINRAKSWLTGDFGDVYGFSSKFITGMIYILVASVLLAVAWFAVEKWRLRRRARRIGLDALPRPDQLRLARQLGFYDELLRLLERHRIRRPRNLTPMEFSQSIAFLPTGAFDTIRGLTEVFYRVRYGRAELSARQRSRLHHVIDGLERALAARSRD
jgi:transglutaminase-like putative cysteine protease